MVRSGESLEDLSRLTGIINAGDPACVEPFAKGEDHAAIPRFQRVDHFPHRPVARDNLIIRPGRDPRGIDTPSLHDVLIAVQVERVACGQAFGSGVTLVARNANMRSEEHTSELQSLMRISYAVFCLKKKHDTTH